MNEFSPYQAPVVPPPPMTPPPGMAPSSVKVFGIIHLVFAAIGFLTAIWGFASKAFMSAILKGDDPAVVAQMRIQEELFWFTLLGSAFTLVLAILLLISGLKLVRQNPDGIRWSNTYSWVSISTKILSAVLTVIYVLPLTNRMMDEILGSSPGAGDQIGGIMKSVTAISSVVGPLVSCLYPALALFFLSRPAVKSWAASR